MQKSRAFTIIELLVVVSIIALLVGILLPAIGKAREQAQLTKSQGNIKQIGAAVQTYSAEYADRQLTMCDDNLASYGAMGAGSMQQYYAVNGYAHPPVILGWGDNGAGAGGTWGYWQWGWGGTNYAGNYICAVPADFSSGDKFGGFRIINARNFNTFVTGRFYDPVFYAPKDTEVMAAVDPYIEMPGEFTNTIAGSGGNGEPVWSSYCFSPAGMVNPDCLSKVTNGNYYTDIWTLPSGFRSPGMSQARYADLKTNVIEHHWLQNRRKTCLASSTFGGALSPYGACWPFFYNGSRESNPVALFYDGHIANRGQRDAVESNAKVAQQTGDAVGGLWSTNTVWAGTYAQSTASTGGYYIEACIDSSTTSYHMLTIDGIKGRDFISK